MALLSLISNQLQISEKELLIVIANANNLYKRYTIPKKSGGKRTIYQPTPGLKVLQYWVVENIFRALPVSAYSMAYEPGCSIKKNAMKHRSARHILKLDIVNFFESITAQHLRDLLNAGDAQLQTNGYDLTKVDRDIILKICLLHDRLTIGSVCAPVISNRVMAKIDEELNEIARDFGVVFTRYVDDMTFSSETFIDPCLVKKARSALLSWGFGLNEKKTVFASAKRRRNVTGLVVDRNAVTIGLERKKLIKRMLYRKIKLDDPTIDSEVLLGHLAFLKDVEPSYYLRLIAKYSQFGSLTEKLRKTLPKDTGN